MTLLSVCMGDTIHKGLTADICVRWPSSTSLSAVQHFDACNTPPAKCRQQNEITTVFLLLCGSLPGSLIVLLEPGCCLADGISHRRELEVWQVGTQLGI